MTPFAISVEYEAVDAYDFVSCDTDPIDKIFFVTNGTDGGEEPAVAAGSLTNIASGSVVNVKLWVFEDVLCSHDQYSSSRLSMARTGTRLTDPGKEVSSVWRSPFKQSRGPRFKSNSMSKC